MADWSEITNKPTSFPPENHDASKVTSGRFATSRVTNGANNRYLKKSGGIITSVPISYTHTQAVADTVWTINHNLSFYPKVIVIDSANDVIFGAIAHTNENQLTITFSGAVAGTAYCS